MAALKETATVFGFFSLKSCSILCDRVDIGAAKKVCSIANREITSAAKLNGSAEILSETVCASRVL